MTTDSTNNFTHHIFLQRLPDGCFIDWGRNAIIKGICGIGGAKYYSGESAEVMKLVLKYTKTGKNFENEAQTNSTTS